MPTTHAGTFKSHAKRENAISGFRKTGLFPWNPNAPDYTKCAAIYGQAFGPAFVFEGLDLNGSVERSTQSECLTLEMATQTISEGTCLCNRPKLSSAASASSLPSTSTQEEILVRRPIGRPYSDVFDTHLQYPSPKKPTKSAANGKRAAMRSLPSALTSSQMVNYLKKRHISKGGKHLFLFNLF